MTDALPDYNPADPLPPAHVAGGDGPLSPRDAARSLSDWRNKQAAAAAEPPKEIKQEASAEPAPPDESEAQADDATPPQEATGENVEADPADDLPPIERPRSWSKEKEAIWTKLDRETQEYLASHDSEVSKGVRKAQNEAAEARKAIEAEKASAEQARQRYEEALPALLQTLHQQQQGEFADIKTMADVEKLAREDWPRYALWDAQQKKIAAVTQEVQAAQHRQMVEKAQKSEAFAKEHDAKLLDRMPELTDKAKQSAVADKLLSMVEEAGLSKDEFARAWAGQGELSIRHSAMQEIMAKAALYELSKAQAAKAVAKPLPPVQKPGAARSATAGTEQQIQNLQKQLSTATGFKAAQIGAQLAKLQRSVAAR